MTSDNKDHVQFVDSKQKILLCSRNKWFTLSSDVAASGGVLVAPVEAVLSSPGTVTAIVRSILRPVLASTYSNAHLSLMSI
jgi:hypothetical protein